MPVRMPTLVLAALLVGHLPGAEVLGQDSAPEETAGAPIAQIDEPTTLAGELARLNSTLTEIKALLERLTESQSLDLLMKRMEVSSTQVAEIEKRLRTAEAERASIEDEKASIESSMRNYEAMIESGTMDADDAQLEIFTTRQNEELARRELRLRSLDEEIDLLRNRLASKQRELEDWQGFVDRRLGGV